MSRPQLSLSKFNIKKNMSFDKEYRASAWLFFNDMWDDNAGSFKPLSPKQQAALQKVHQLLYRNNMCVRLSIQERSGDDVRQYPRTGNFSLRVNEPEKVDDLDNPHDPLAIFDNLDDSAALDDLD